MPRNPFRRIPSTLIASGESIDISSETAVSYALKGKSKWKQQAFDQFDACPQLHNGCTQLADLISRLSIFPAEQPKDRDAKPMRSTDPSDISTLDRLGTVIDISQLLYDYALLSVIVGEAQLVGIQPGPDRPGIEVETWRIYSEFELEGTTIPGTSRAGVRIIDFADGQPLTLDQAVGDTWIRLWRSHPRHKQQATSHVFALRGAIDELLWWNHSAIAVARNRLITAGALGIPSNIELPPEAGEPARLSGAERFAKRFFNLALKTIQNPGAASASIPLMFTYPWNESGKSGLDFTNFPREQDSLLKERTDFCLATIAQGFPLPVEAFFGMANVTSWNGRDVSEAKLRENVEPFIVFLLTALTQAWYRPIRRAEGAEDWHKKMLWYDASNLIIHPDLPTGADKGFEYGIISDSSWRRIRGFSERDKASPEEREERLEWLRGLRGRDLSPPSGNNPDDPSEQPDQPDTPGDRAKEDMPTPGLRGKGQQQQQQASAATNGHATLDIGRKLAEIDADLLSRVQVMCDAAMRTEQVRAGNKLANRANKNSRLKQLIAKVPKEDIAATLGRETVIQLGIDDLFTDSFESVPDQFCRWCDAALFGAYDLVGLREEVKEAASLAELHYAPDEAAQLLVRDLRSLAKTLLFDRASNMGPSPESDDLLVSAGIIRKALNRAGGNDSPSLMLVTGPAVTKTLATKKGMFVASWDWWTGPKPRAPYAPHDLLDGKSFDISHPERPGSHENCSCIAVPSFG